MEALAALSLAGNVIQFVQFVGQIICTSTQISGSKQGASQSALEIEDIYAKLSSLSSYFQRGDYKVQQTTKFVSLNASLSGPVEVSQDEIQAHAGELQKLGAQCGPLCDELVEIVRGLRVSAGSPLPCKSFRAALRSAWNTKKIKDLEDRLRRYREAITMHFFPLFA